MDETTSKRSQPSEAATWVVYDKKRGHIVHVHQVITLPGVKCPVDEDMARFAHETACHNSGRRASDLGVLRSEPNELEFGNQYHVDIKTRRLKTIERGTPKAMLSVKAKAKVKKKTKR